MTKMKYAKIGILRRVGLLMIIQHPAQNRNATKLKPVRSDAFNALSHTQLRCHRRSLFSCCCCSMCNVHGAQHVAIS